ncbi:hypothetical protein H6G89_01300 [Oscillatoria sp. FACHB-1407]|uniref:hypothetical protein n=1 Tax=Oscillatoria sp. FACHB-1407 TaxID=2692847 RepID=UPI00168916FF|nr:hypothetical protein [Oscillatoria sp. FACHB-1407]MBD2459666.1 hypothetical protein [Oscillatoria sp. FACHB-1407]
MSITLVSGSAGLIGSEAASYFGNLGLAIVGLDNDMRRVFQWIGDSTALWSTILTGTWNTTLRKSLDLPK